MDLERMEEGTPSELDHENDSRQNSADGKYIIIFCCCASQHINCGFWFVENLRVESIEWWITWQLFGYYTLQK